MNDTPEIDAADAKARLLARRQELVHLTEASVEARRPVELDQARVGRLSRMDAMQSQAMSIETDRRRQVEVRRIDAALTRLDDGEYGFCASCGEAIALKRLEFDPTTPVCIDCARGPDG
ncbi:MAG: TraR/DksA C4-type zinc finger protein [Proteobacteria bacterium]|nr:TraR/DksA C4-type zinc finger protein [Pseudomonadota bacterium]